MSNMLRDSELVTLPANAALALPSAIELRWWKASSIRNDLFLSASFMASAELRILSHEEL